ncbi:cytochrome P450 [Rhodococcus erythropolis]|uniref:cytochrome P450 n=1 Tax=Rhodococcus erythropolis TaxID=1833 RepID=UPI00382354C5
MTASISDTEFRVPEKYARAAILPESYTDEQHVVYPAFEWLRKNNSFGLAHIEGYDPIWLATKHADILEIEKNGEVFTSGRDEPNINDSASAGFLKMVNSDGSRTLDTLAYMDAPEHTKIKNVTAAWFMPANVRKREDDIRALAKAAVDKLLSGNGECDFVKDFAVFYPLRVIMSLFGVPEEDEPRMLTLTQEMFAPADPDTQRAETVLEPDAMARIWKAAIDDFSTYFNELAAQRRANPTDDLASIIANAKVDGEYLPASFINGYYVAIATAGHDTTSSTVSGAIKALVDFPDQFDKVRNDPSLIPALIDEAVRYISPVKHFQRVVSRDFEFRGRQLKEGDHVMLLYPSANRDEKVFDNADTFDITRRPNKHIAFGHGPHMCIGQHVAKLEMRILFEELLPRISKIEITGEPKYVAANFLSGLKSLPVRITKA